MYLRSELVTGLNTGAVIDNIPFEGVSLLLGNGLARQQASRAPHNAVGTEALEREFPEAFTACVLKYYSLPAVSRDVSHKILLCHFLTFSQNAY